MEKQKNTDRVYFSAKKNIYDFLTNNSNLPNWSQLKECKDPVKVLSGNQRNVLVFKKNNKLEMFQKTGTSKITYRFPNEKIVDISAGYQTYCVLTNKGNVYSLASCHWVEHEDSEDSSEDFLIEVPVNDSENCTYEKPLLVDFFPKNGLNLGIGNNENKKLPFLIQDNVTNVFCGVYGMSLFFTKTDNKLYSCGENTNGTLAIGTKGGSINTPQIVCGWKASDILDIRNSYQISILLTKDGNLYSCGVHEHNGHDGEKLIFTQIRGFKDKKIIKISLGWTQTLAFTSENELYGWGFNKDEEPTNQYELSTNKWNNPRKIDLPSGFKILNSNHADITSGLCINYIYNSHSSCIVEDFETFYNQGKFTDHLLLDKYPIHKLLLELRTNLKIKQVEKIFKEKASLIKEDIGVFLKWVYCDQINNETILQEMFNSLNLNFPQLNTFKQDLLKYYKDEDSKDFNILVQLDDEEDDDEVGEAKELPVHKFILLARCGLFREMFQNINENDNEIKQIKDYSGKSIESLEIFIQYLYTNKIELTANDDPILIHEELSEK
ncbi:btk-binding protein-related [Anaeramoeba flamelloides]|uniref:Btk-binding protein-related n=1 Tax=Anaeramoeba flamelloides TaxID=1746091 RepID=A0AAV7Z7A1_9EUKA|nr:btk-binding protein-related [Anaeramoeba flamelloides]